MILLNGKYDFFFPYETSQLPYFELLGIPPEHKKIVLDATGRAFPTTGLARESLTCRSFALIGPDALATGQPLKNTGVPG